MNFSSNNRIDIYTSTSRPRRRSLPGQQGSLVMPSPEPTTETVIMLTPQLLAEARSARPYMGRPGALRERRLRDLLPARRQPSFRSLAHLRDVPGQRPVPGVRDHGQRAARCLGRSRPARAAYPAPPAPAAGTACGLAHGKRSVTPEEHRLRARIAANARWSRAMARADQAATARAAILAVWNGRSIPPAP